ncbi:U11/U12 small nuclear ribonucleoprotein 65 kDa protein [Physcomitrium patens]|uniref:RRM domain-containing protein n=1 Tax=Physcomitrium patens TaxID=3218 RepID=A0A7I4DQY3_PHYPA|nr:U11/U12 small nuclear ribonucleoprotein 65 kDa protein-like [Physcomitrium patens]|eukprot:XP_024375226.1 U11/U12 small nuclear ribonucleoprotein 65 kDa protein-like [Physcomitrella patens]
MSTMAPSPPPLPPPSSTPAVQGARVTLLIRHLPEGLMADTLKRLFSHYGASDFRLCTSGRLKNCAFVDYDNESAAAAAQSQMHRLRFLGKILSVERAIPESSKDGLSGDSSMARSTDAGADTIPPHPPPEPPLVPQTSEIHQAGRGATGMEPIAPALGVDYPFPPQLEYAYPPPDGNILTNIVNTLIAVPRFYTQVLHLMNKMNLPAPFRPALPTPPLPPPIPAPPVEKRQAGELSSGESELESSDEEDNNAPGGEEESVVPDKDLDAHRARRKRAKLGAVVGPAVDKDASHESAGVKSISVIPRAAPIKKNKPVMQIKISTKTSASEGPSRDISFQDEMDVPRTKVDDSSKRASRAELQGGQMSEAEMLALPILKNYAAGAPSQVLYIKNLAKEVTSEDLFYVFGAFFPTLDETKAALNVNLMQEGRMRGQAFVTFPSTEAAQDALGLTHGFVLKGKPMIVQFGRNRSAAKT